MPGTVHQEFLMSQEGARRRPGAAAPLETSDVEKAALALRSRSPSQATRACALMVRCLRRAVDAVLLAERCARTGTAGTGHRDEGSRWEDVDPVEVAALDQGLEIVVGRRSPIVHHSGRGAEGVIRRCRLDCRVGL